MPDPTHWILLYLQEGGELFNDLCMWVDINQKYVELGLFPQWYDIARELNIDQVSVPPKV